MRAFKAETRKSKRLVGCDGCISFSAKNSYRHQFLKSPSKCRPSAIDQDELNDLLQDPTFKMKVLVIKCDPIGTLVKSNNEILLICLRVFDTIGLAKPLQRRRTIGVESCAV